MVAQALKARLALRMGALAFLALFLAGSAFGQNWVEERTYFSGNGATPRIDGLLTRPVKGGLGSFAWFQVQQGYGQAYAGATYSPKPWVQFALGGGLEEDKHPARIGSYVWAGKGRVSGLGVFEDGGSGFWYKVETNCQVTAGLGLGTLTEANNGTGPKLELALPHTPFKLWFAPLWKGGSLVPLVGLRWLL